MLAKQIAAGRLRQRDPKRPTTTEFKSTAASCLRGQLQDLLLPPSTCFVWPNSYSSKYPRVMTPTSTKQSRLLQLQTKQRFSYVFLTHHHAVSLLQLSVDCWHLARNHHKPLGRYHDGSPARLRLSKQRNFPISPSKFTFTPSSANRRQPEISHPSHVTRPSIYRRQSRVAPVSRRVHPD